MPIPQGASLRYFFMTSWFSARAPLDASFLLKALLMRRICPFPFPILVKTSIKTNSVNTIVKGIAILKDFDRKIYATKPAIKHAMAVRVPEGNIPQMQAMPINRKK